MGDTTSGDEDEESLTEYELKFILPLRGLLTACRGSCKKLISSLSTAAEKYNVDHIDDVGVAYEPLCEAVDNVVCCIDHQLDTEDFWQAVQGAERVMNDVATSLEKLFVGQEEHGKWVSLVKK